MEQEDFSKYNGEGTVLRNAQLRMVEILVQIDKIFRKHQIPYWLDSGTLLGAVRHGGFIPWDDDMDICIRREDYKKIKECLMAELPDKFVFEDISTDKYYYDISPRVKDRNSFIDYPLFSKQKVKGLWVDLLIMERIPSMKLKKVIDFFYGRIHREAHHFGDAKYKSSIKRIVSKTIAYSCYPIISFFLYIIRHLTPKSTKTYGHTYGVGYKSLRLESDIFPCKQINFEGKTFLSPADSDAYLKALYRDYMKIPPVEKREVHTNHIEIY